MDKGKKLTNTEDKKQMKVEDSGEKPKLVLNEPEGTRPQGHSENVSHIITENDTFPVKPGTFHYYFTKTSDGRNGVPFIQFDVPNQTDDDGFLVHALAGHRIEIVNISTVVGIAYKVTDDE